MSKKILSTPKKDGFYMPAEHELHSGCWMIWPERTDNWRMEAKPAQEIFAKVANIIAKYESVTMLVSAKQYHQAKLYLTKTIKLIKMANNEAWIRDVGPTFVINKKTGEVRGIDWIFNAWGGLLDGFYYPWDDDDEIASKVCNLINLHYYRAPFVLEGGAIHSDGEGTIYTTEECLLNPNRNPSLNKEQIEIFLKEYLGAEKIIWLPLGIFNDETNGHVDNLLHIVEPGHVVLTWTDNKEDPQYHRSEMALDVLNKTKDAKGRTIKVTKLHQPDSLFYDEREIKSFDSSAKILRTINFRLPASYTNFYIANGAIILPIFNDEKWDKNAIDVLQRVFPNYQIEPIYAKEILLGGGNIHYITLQQIIKIKENK